MFSGRLALCAIVDVGPRQQLVDFAHGMAVGDFVEDVGEPRLRIDIVQLAGLDETCTWMAARCRPRPSRQNSHDFRPSATPRSARSAALLKGMVSATPLFRLAFIA